MNYVPSVLFFNKSPSRRAAEAARHEEIQRRIYAENLDKKKEVVAARKINTKAHVCQILFKDSYSLPSDQNLGLEDTNVDKDLSQHSSL